MLGSFARGEDTGMKRLFALLCSVAVCACNPAEEPPTTVVSAGDPGTIEGDWTVVATNGQPFTNDSVKLRAGPQIAEWNPGCQQLMHRYWIDGESFIGQRLRYTMSEVDTPTSSLPPPCPLGLLPELEDAMFAFDTAETVERLEGGRIRISGGGRSVTLER